MRPISNGLAMRAACREQEGLRVVEKGMFGKWLA
jgi:hypothetical protein